MFSASVTLYRFGSSGAAKRALKRVKAHVKGCPKYTEWVCTQCDGIFDVWQQLASVPTIGDGTVAWAGRQMDNFGSRFRKAVVRDGRIVIEARVSVGSADPTVGPRFPSTRPTKGQLRKVATTAYWAAPWG